MSPVMSQKPAIATGSPCSVKINGEFTPATYVDWSDKYNLPIVMVGGRRMYRRIFDADATAVLRARPADRSVPLADRLPQPIEIESSRPSLLAMNRVRAVPLNTRLREGDVVDHYGVRATVVRVSDCSADVELPRQAREITTRDGDSRTVLGSPRVIRISPNSELPILSRR
jgi:hypothetical protein